jgi:hypothetical protein
VTVKFRKVKLKTSEEVIIMWKADDKMDEAAQARCSGETDWMMTHQQTDIGR